jgi:hypothetical protein
MTGTLVMKEVEQELELEQVVATARQQLLLPLLQAQAQAQALVLALVLSRLPSLTRVPSWIAAPRALVPAQVVEMKEEL